MNAQLDFPHIVGHHCSSTSIADLLRYDNQDQSEAIAFGLGAGLGFSYLEHDPQGSASYQFNGRAPNLEEKFYRHIGQPITWIGEWSPEKMALALESGRPILAVSDIYHLPYYQPQVHFRGHGIIVVGINTTEQTATIADLAAADPFTIPLANLQGALSENAPPMMKPNQWIAAPQLQNSPVTTTAIRQAIATCATEMLAPKTAVEGLPAMRHMAASLPTWHHAEDWAWCARFGYQAIEKRGTGGGGFRKLYGHFLAEASQLFPVLATIDASKRMIAIGDKWTQLAICLKEIFKTKNKEGFVTAQAILHDIIHHEANLMTELQNNI